MFFLCFSMFFNVDDVDVDVNVDVLVVADVVKTVSCH